MYRYKRRSDEQDFLVLHAKASCIRVADQALERATLQRLVAFAPEAVRARLSELHAEAEAQLDALAPAYALALLQNSAPRQPHQDMLFFRALYEVSCPVGAALR